MLNQLYREVLDHMPQTRTYPLWNAHRTEGGYVLEVAVTGFSKDDLDVTLDRGVLRVEGTAQVQDCAWIVHQITHKSFARTWTIPEGMNIGDVKLHNGVLTISISGTPESTVRRFEVM